MTRWNLGLALVVGALLAGCQTAADNKALEQQKSQDLEKRVAELERKATPSPEVTIVTEPAWEAQLQPAPPAAAAPRSAGRASARASGPARREAPRATAPRRPEEPPVVTSSRHEPDQVTTRPEPVERPGEAFDPAPRVARDEQERAERISIPAGTQLALVLETPLSSATSQPGDRVEARVERATSEDGRVLLPGGTVLKGRVVEARSAGRVKGKARLAVAFDQIVVRGRTQRLETTEIEATAADSHERDAAMIGGGAAAGAIIGGITGGGSGAKKGAIIGGAAGTGAVLATKGKEVDLPSGSRWTVRVKDGVRF